MGVIQSEPALHRQPGHPAPPRDLAREAPLDILLADAAAARPEPTRTARALLALLAGATLALAGCGGGGSTVDEVAVDVPVTTATFTNSSGIANLSVEYVGTLSWTNHSAAAVAVELAGEVGGQRNSGPGQAYVHIFRLPTAPVGGMFPGAVGPQRYLSVDAGYTSTTYTEQMVLAPGESVHLGMAAVIQAADGTVTQVTVGGHMRITVLDGTTVPTPGVDCQARPELCA